MYKKILLSLLIITITFFFYKKFTLVEELKKKEFGIYLEFDSYRTQYGYSKNEIEFKKFIDFSNSVNNIDNTIWKNKYYLIDEPDSLKVFIKSIYLFYDYNILKLKKESIYNISFDSIDENTLIISKYLNSKPENPIERIFLKSNVIDFTKSNFLAKRNNNLYYYSSYSENYPISKGRFVMLLHNENITNNFSNLSDLKLDTIFFNQNGFIENFNNKVSKKSKLLETIFIDSTIINTNEKQQLIRNIEISIDTDNLLIDILKNKYPQFQNLKF